MEVSILSRRKTMYIKIKDGIPSIKSTRQMKVQVDTTQRKNKSKQSTKNKKKIYANRTYGYEMMINNNKEDLK
jgi:hypothetical protein